MSGYSSYLGISLIIEGGGTGSILVTNPSTNKVYYNDVLEVINDETIQVRGNIIPTPTQVWSLGSTGSRWQSIYVGNSTVNIGDATVSSDNDGIAYTQNGFATPFINIGPIISPNIGAIGGWNVTSSGDPI